MNSAAPIPRQQPLAAANQVHHRQRGGGAIQLLWHGQHPDGLHHRGARKIPGRCRVHHPRIQVLQLLHAPARRVGVGSVLGALSNHSLDLARLLRRARRAGVLRSGREQGSAHRLSLLGIDVDRLRLGRHQAVCFGVPWGSISNQPAASAAKGVCRILLGDQLWLLFLDAADPANQESQLGLGVWRAGNLDGRGHLHLLARDARIT